jgi:hypothetical protein
LTKSVEGSWIQYIFAVVPHQSEDWSVLHFGLPDIPVAILSCNGHRSEAAPLCKYLCLFSVEFYQTSAFAEHGTKKKVTPFYTRMAFLIYWTWSAVQLYFCRKKLRDSREIVMMWVSDILAILVHAPHDKYRC